MYLDMGHLEWASPECESLSDVVAADRAGDQLLQDAIQDLGLADTVSLIKNNVDHETDATFGSHENYLVSRRFPFTRRGLGPLVTFLVTRQIFTGAGRVGAAGPRTPGFRWTDSSSREERTIATRNSLFSRFSSLSAQITS